MKNLINRALVAKKKFLLFAALTLSAGMWAIDGVKYIDANGVEQTANGVNEITNSSATLSGGWYVVYGADVQTRMLVCKGDVHLILADGAKLTATGIFDLGDKKFSPGIRVQGNVNSLTIYGQAGQVGQLIANGTDGCAGIGNEKDGAGSYITINGGIVTATGGDSGAGIGSGKNGKDIHITINGGFITANGGLGARGIGCGEFGTDSEIYVRANLVVKVGFNNPPTTVIEYTGGNIANSIYDRCVMVEPGSLDNVKANAIAVINAAIEGVTDSHIISIANQAISDIGSAGTVHDVISIKATALAEIKAKLFSSARTDAIAAIESAATDAKAEIDAASSYTAADAIKAQYKNKVDDAVAEAKAIIEAATTVQGVDEERSKCILKIENHLAAAKAAIASIGDLEKYRAKVIGEIENARLHNLLPELDEEQQGYVNETIDDAVNAVNAATTITEMDKAEAKIFFILSMYPAGQAAALGEMAEPCDDCPAVEVWKDGITITLYAPEGVKFKKTEAAED